MTITWEQLSFFSLGFTRYESVYSEAEVMTDFDAVVEQLDWQMMSGFSILPAPEDILNAFKYTPFDQVKVVILGQDPYPNKAHAHGLAFSVPEGVHPYPASLRNIFKELQSDLGCPEPTSGCLIPWAEQGVLLLNTCLTVVEGSIGSHSKIGWHPLATQVLQQLSLHREHIVFILWGKVAQGKSFSIRTPKNHCIIRGAHPSPLSANKGGFFGTKPFSRANEYLVEHGIEPIRWNLD